jgi:hypothetical protein
VTSRRARSEGAAKECHGMVAQGPGYCNLTLTQQGIGARRQGGMAETSHRDVAETWRKSWDVKEELGWQQKGHCSDVMG